MIITDDFVMLNLPKTGSTFARKAIRTAYGQHKISRLLSKIQLIHPCVIDLATPNLDFLGGRGGEQKNQHGVLRQIPKEHKNKPIVSITRNPFSRYVSAYTYKSWQNKQRFSQYPNFPNLSFAEFYQMKQDIDAKQRLHGIHPKIPLGFYTVQFIQFYFAQPEKVLKKIDNHYIESEQFKNDMSDISFLQQENLNQDLGNFLAEKGIPSKKLAFLKDAKKINVALGDKDFWQFYTPKLIEQVLERDKLLFKIFPQYLPTSNKN
ncbi:hypothetical protein SPONN_2294 [uncultured Candidatus Thioglobus sp.]|nr:hypothetical protein SPONN_2294 [uncultured Candidatus Thioglobus sp.]